MSLHGPQSAGSKAAPPRGDDGGPEEAEVHGQLGHRCPPQEYVLVLTPAEAARLAPTLNSCEYIVSEKMSESFIAIRPKDWNG